jgi:hypothetical protein
MKLPEINLFMNYNFKKLSISSGIMTFFSSGNTSFPTELEKLSISSGITKFSFELEALRISAEVGHVLTEIEKSQISQG